jgi:hypothetical protein
MRVWGSARYAPRGSRVGIVGLRAYQHQVYHAHAGRAIRRDSWFQHEIPEDAPDLQSVLPNRPKMLSSCDQCDLVAVLRQQPAVIAPNPPLPMTAILITKFRRFLHSRPS